MPRSPAQYLWDAEHAAGLALRFVEGRAAQDLDTDALLRSAVERQVQIVGEALSQLAQQDASYQSKIPELPRIVGLRNILVHGYAMVDLKRLWDIVTEDLSAIRMQLQDLLREVTE